MSAVVLCAERRPFAPVVGGQSGVGGRDVGAGHLERVARHDPHVGRSAGEQRGECDDVVLDDHVGLDARDDLAELRLAEHRTVDQGLPGRLHERRELLDRGLAEFGRGLADELLPESSGILLDLLALDRLRGRREIDEVLLEAERCELALPRRLGSEDDTVPALAQDVADADALVGRAVGRLGHEQDGERAAHRALLEACVR